MYQPSKKMFKVLCPLDKPNGTTWWFQLGSGFENKDASINMVLNARPLAGKSGTVRLQLREYTEAEMRERDARRASYSSRDSSSALSNLPGGFGSGAFPSPATDAADQPPPF